MRLQRKQRLHIPICEELNIDVGDVVEFSGTEDVGKSEVLMSIIAPCILPKSLSGCECDVVYVSTNHIFNITMLLNVIERKVTINGDQGSFVDSVLDRFHHFTCVSIADCIMTLKTLLLHPSMYYNVGVVVIDDIGGFQLEGKTHSKISSDIGDCVNTLTEIIQEYNIITILNHFLQFPSEKYYFKPWLKLIRYRFKLASSDISSKLFQKKVSLTLIE